MIITFLLREKNPCRIWLSSVTRANLEGWNCNSFNYTPAFTSYAGAGVTLEHLRTPADNRRSRRRWCVKCLSVCGSPAFPSSIFYVCVSPLPSKKRTISPVHDERDYSKCDRTIIVDVVFFFSIRMLLHTQMGWTIKREPDPSNCCDSPCTHTHDAQSETLNLQLLPYLCDTLWPIARCIIAGDNPADGRPHRPLTHMLLAKRSAKEVA